MKVDGVFGSPITNNGMSPILMGVVSGWWQSPFDDEGELEAATFGMSADLRSFFVQNVYNVPEATYPTVSGPALSDLRFTAPTGAY